MFFYAAKVFTATVTGTTIKLVRCEKCDTEFGYQLARIGAAGTQAPFFIGQRSAKERAARQAQGALQSRLAREVELVPCPHCHWVNESAIRLFRKSRYRAWNWIIGIMIFFGLFLDALLYFEADDIFRHPPALLIAPIIVITCVAIGIAFVILLLRAWARRRINPNQKGGAAQYLPPATPPALLIDPATQAVKTFPNQLPPGADARWAIFRAGQLSFEPLCCTCLAEPDRVYGKSALRKFIGVATSALPAPLCRRCQWRLRMQWCMGALAALAVAFVAGWLLAHLHENRADRSLMTFVYGFVCALAALAFANHWLSPYRIRTLDPLRGVWAIAFRNRAYTAVLIRRMGQSEGFYPQPQVTAVDGD